MAFTADGEHLVGGTVRGVRVWRVKDGQQVATMAVEHSAWLVAVSRDGRWIAAGTDNGEVFVWDATTHERVFANEIGSDIWDVDFSPDATLLVSADSEDHTATVWDILAHHKVHTLDHDSEWVYVAKYSPQGDRIATATDESVRVWDSNDGRLLVDVNVGVYASGNLWCNNHLFVKTRDGTIKQINAATGSTVSEWPVPDADDWSCIAMPQHGKFLAYSTKESNTCWDTATHTQLHPIQPTRETCFVACSSNGHLAISGERKIIVKDPSSTIFRFIFARSVSCPCPPLSHLTFQEPELDIDSAALGAWSRGQLADAEVLLSAAIPTSHHALASRALVRARLQQLDAALIDAEEVLVALPLHI